MNLKMEIIRIPSLTTCTFKLLSDVTWPKELSFFSVALSTGELKLRPICHATVPHYLPLCTLCRH